jgi:acyl-CoA thioester hydrolase
MSCEIRVYYEDTDAGGVVYYANYLKFAERARTEWLRGLGFEQRTLWQMHGVGFVVKSCTVDYHAPAFLDDILQVSATVTEAGRSSLTMQQQVMRDNTSIATISALLVCVNTTFKPTRLPDAMREKLLCSS